MLKLKNRHTSPPTGFMFKDLKSGWSTHSWSFNAAAAAWYQECIRRKKPISIEQAQSDVEKFVCEQIIKTPDWDQWLMFDERPEFGLFEQNISVIIAVYKPDIEKLNNCLNSVLPQVKEVFVVSDGVPPTGVVDNKKIRLIPYAQEEGYSKKANYGAEHAHCDYLWFLNDDCYPSTDCAERLMEVMTFNPSIGIVGHFLEYPDGRVQHGGTVRSPDGIGFSHIRDSRINQPVEMESVTGASILVRKDHFDSVGGYDESYFLYLEDSDLCLKMRQKGYKVFYTPYAKAVHEEGQSTSKTKSLDVIIQSSMAIFKTHWHNYFIKNPAPVFKPEPKRPLTIDVLYVHVLGDKKYEQFAKRFVESAVKYPPGHKVKWVIVLNGNVMQSLSREMDALFKRLGDVDYFSHDNSGWDIGAYQAYCKFSTASMCVFLGGSSYCRRPNWILPMIRAFNRYGENAIYGTCAHLGAINVKVWPHIRTTGFFCSPSTLNKYPNVVKTTQERYPFEHGVNSLTQWALRRSMPVFVVDAEGEWKYPMWTMSKNGYHAGTQRDLLVGDRITEPPFYAIP